MIQTIYYEDYRLEEKRESYGRTITEADIVAHAGQSGDFFPHHMDKEWCKNQDFQERIAHGTLIFSIAVGSTAVLINPVAFSYGYDRLRFVQPVFIGDTIRTLVKISKKKLHERKQNFGVVIESLETLNQKNETVLVCDHLLMVQMKNSDSL